MKSGSLNLLEPSEPVQTCNWFGFSLRSLSGLDCLVIALSSFSSFLVRLTFHIMRESCILGFKVSTGSQTASIVQLLPRSDKMILSRPDCFWPDSILLQQHYWKANDFFLSVNGLAVTTCDPSLYHEDQTTAQSLACVKGDPCISR
jgi:hypothetical protein